MTSSPFFIDNRKGNTLSVAIREHLRALREVGQSPEEVCIATGYFNAAGWLQVATEAERLDKVRLLIGAEPKPSHELTPRQPGDPREPERTKQLVQSSLDQQVRGLAEERDHGFGFDPDHLEKLKRLVAFFRSGKVEVRRYQERFFHAKAWLLRGKHSELLAGSSNLTAAGMLHNLELNLGHDQGPILEKVETWYDEVWEEAVPFDLAELYEILFEDFGPWLIYLRTLWELYGEEVLEEEEEEGSTHIILTRFQKHGIWRAKHILENLGGVVVADGVGLGKTFVAGGLMEEYRDRRQRILLIRPASLDGTWSKFLNRYMLEDVEAISYEKLARDNQLGGDQPHLKRPLHEYQLVVIDEAHNYRNPDAPTRAGVLRALMRGQRRDLVLLTATPVNNSLYDLYHLVSFFLKQDSRLLDKGIASIKGIFDEANSVDPDDLHPDLLYPLVDATTVKRTRKFIKKHYEKDRIPGPDGELVPISFPKPVPLTVHYNLDEVLPGFFAHFATALMPETGPPLLTLARYQVERYLLDPEEAATEETSLVGLLRSGLLKRFESSAHAFANTCQRMARQHRQFLRALEEGQVIRKDFFRECGGADDIDDEEFRDLLEGSGHVEAVELFDEEKLKEDVENDLALLEEFAQEAATVSPEADPKLQAVVEELVAVVQKAKEDSISEEEERINRKVLIFSYFKDTALWITNWLHKVVQTDERLACFRNRIAVTSGSPDEGPMVDSDQAVWGFAPESAAPDNYQGGDRFDVLIATDVLAEGVNLQQARNIINYDMPWNPMRLIQRHGRIDRLLSKHKRVFLRTFFPDSDLDDLLNLEQRVRRKLALAAASVGVSVTPILHGAERDQSFSEAREEIEKIAREDGEIFERGGTESAAQTGEEYRQELRKALESNLKATIQGLPWKAGAGMRKGKRSGHFFCAKVGQRTFLRFVPEEAQTPEDLVAEVGTCLRLIECSEETPSVSPDGSLPRAFQAWELASESIWRNWDFYTDPSNLQPRLRKLNREVRDFLMENPPMDQESDRLEDVSDILGSRWPMREESKLRQVWKAEFTSHQAKAAALMEAVEATGIEPYEQPERFPKIDLDEVRLVCWMQIQSE